MQNSFTTSADDSGILFSERVGDIKLLQEQTPLSAKALVTRNAAPECVTDFFLNASQATIDKLSSQAFTLDQTTKNLEENIPIEVSDFIIKIAGLMRFTAGNCNSLGFRIIEHIAAKIPSAAFHHDPPFDPNCRPLRSHIGLTSSGGLEMEILASENIPADDLINYYMGYTGSTKSLPEPSKVLTTNSGDLTTFWSADYWTNNPNTGYLIHRTHPSKVQLPKDERRVSLLWQALRPPIPGRELI